MSTDEMTVGLLSWRASRLANLDVFLGKKVRYVLPGLLGDVSVLAGWGYRSKSQAARRLAAHKGLPFVYLEDGFLRSLSRNDPPLSVILDDLGIYYDANAPSRLECMIWTPLDLPQTIRAKELINIWREQRVSKYNAAREYEGQLPERYVLVCDQTRGDASIIHGQANTERFSIMLNAALAENPNSAVLVKVHPDVLTRKRRSHFDAASIAHPRIILISENCHPARLIENASVVYTVTSQMGFEALLWGKRVRCFGMPFYAGWGLTEDYLSTVNRRGPVSLEQLVHAALISYPRYIDPEIGERCEVETIVAHIGLQRRMRARFPQRIYALGFSRWKRRSLKRFLAGSEIEFKDDSQNIPHGAMVALWGSSFLSTLLKEPKTLRFEDGFLRSVGLGADLIRPLSWACDNEGIYYDATRPSQLERILTETVFDPAILVRSQILRDAIRNAGLTKYNLGPVSSSARRLRQSGNKVILVPGQVEGDASIRLGAPKMRTNLGLLQAVHDANRDAHIIYKPHPDVISGLRQAGEGEKDVANFCDEIITKMDMALLLKEVDEVHTLTSLTGFEALIRGIKVTCYGQPFYAGWGITTDIFPISRRTRKLSIDELIVGCLILYPTYVSRVTGNFITPELAVNQLIAWRDLSDENLPALRKVMRPILRRWKAFTAR